jgi:hypothetical protein
MKYAIIAACCIVSIMARSQSIINKVIVRDHRTGSTVREIQVFSVPHLLKFNDPVKADKAIHQSDVIGNDFYGPERIGTAYGKNGFQRSDFIPVDGFKRTLTGKGYAYDYHDGVIDDDLNVYIESFDPIIEQHAQHIKSFGTFFEKSINIVEGEIDVQDGMHKFFQAPYPIPGTQKHADPRFADRISLYGAWVVERGSSGKPNNHEVHPMEQFWWRSDDLLRTNGIQRYYLNLAVDASGAFNSRDDFDSDDGPLIKPWGESPLSGTFAIRFEIDRSRKIKLTYDISSIAARNAEAPSIDPKLHYLIIEGDTLLTARELMSDNIVSVDFTDIGYIDSNSPTGKLQGFLIIKSRINKKSTLEYAGSLRLQVEKKTISQIQTSYSVEFLRLERLENNSFRYRDAANGRVYTSPATVPANFNEETVFVQLTRPGAPAISLPVSTLPKNQFIALTPMKFLWSGSVLEFIEARLKCYNNAAKTIQTGEFYLLRSPSDIAGPEQTANTTVSFEFSPTTSDNQVVETAIFRLYFKVTPLSSRAAPLTQ